MQRSRFVPIAGVCLIVASGHATAPWVKPSPWEREVFYQIFPNSFRDSNGDGVGDFKGIESKLGFLQDLGVTTILINPIFKSRFYHRYFADDFLHVAPAYGTNQDFFHLVRAAHRKRLKVILDMEVQYVADRHPWYIQAHKDPASAIAKYFWPNRSVYTTVALPGYDGQTIRANAIDPDNPAVLKEIQKVFAFWTAPKGDRNSGVDGFRIDHMMDDFDGQKVKTGMLTKFWAPIIRETRRVKPGAFFVGEQSDWKYGRDLMDKANVDAVFGFPLRTAYTTPGNPMIESVMNATVSNPPPGKTQLIFIENHDTERFASIVGGNETALRQGAVLNLTFKGAPVIYQGQELGMRGIQLHGPTDANDIPVRLGYRWNSRVDANGTPRWYIPYVSRETTDFSKSADGISVEEEFPKQDSLLNFYRALIHARQNNEVLRSGGQTQIHTNEPSVVGYVRADANTHVRVAVFLNLSDRRAQVNVNWPPDQSNASGWSTMVPGSGTLSGSKLTLPPHGYFVGKPR